MAKIIEVPADIHEDVDALFQTVDREADMLVTELLQDRLRALRDLIGSALLARYRKGYDQGERSGESRYINRHHDMGQ